MKRVTLCFPVTKTHLLLAAKKQGHGTGYLNGFGGKLSPDEDERVGAARELFEECSLVAEPAALDLVARIQFDFDGVPVFECMVFLVSEFRGEPRESEEMGQPLWYARGAIPFDKMWPADMIWISRVLGNERIQGRVHFNAKDNSIREYAFLPLIS